MKHTKYNEKTPIIALAAALLVAPIASAKSAKNDADKMAEKVIAHGKLSIEIGGISLPAEELRGAEVVNLANEKIGEVEDFVFERGSGESSHLIVSTDNWFDGNSAVVPVGKFSVKGEPLTDDMGKEFTDWVRGTTLQLDMTEEAFDEIASLSRGQDLQGFLKSSAADVSQALNLNESDYYSSKKTYRSWYTDREIEVDSDVNPKQTLEKYSSKKTLEEKRYKFYNDSDEVVKDRELKFSGQSVKVSDLKGAVVVNRDDERLGKVVDIAMDKNEVGEHFLVVRTDDWFDGDHALVPASSIEYHADADMPHPQDAANWWNGEHVVLDMKEDLFEEIATFDRDSDFNSYINDNARQLNDSFGGNTIETPLASGYMFVYSYPIDWTLNGYSSTETQKDDKSSFSPKADAKLKVDGQQVVVRDLKGRPVMDAKGRKIGSVSDVVFEKTSEEARFVVIDRNKDGRRSVIPVGAISKKEPETRNVEKKAIWNGKALEIDAKAKEIENWVAFRSSEDFSQFLAENAEELSEAFGIEEADLADSEKEYLFVFEAERFETASR